MLSFTQPFSQSNQLLMNRGLFLVPFYTIAYYFTNAENLYFLLLSLVQLSTLFFLPKNLSPTGPYSTLIPLFLCVGIEIIKDVVNWCHTYAQIQRVNNRLLTALDANGKFFGLYNKNLCPGHVIILKRNQVCPAFGICVKVVPGDSQLKLGKSLLTGETTMSFSPVWSQVPWNYTLDLQNQTLDNINITSYVIEPGTIIKSDEAWIWITKIQNNPITIPNPTLPSQLDIHVSTCMLTTSLYILLALITTFVASRVTTLSGIIYRAVQGWILFNGIIPFSAKIMLMLVCGIQLYFIPRFWALPATIQLNSLKLDELDYIDHLVSDKTGTLTTNKLAVSYLPQSKKLLQAAKLCINRLDGMYLTLEDQVIDTISYSLEDEYRIIQTSKYDFTFGRKRSSVIVQNLSTLAYYIFTKGSISTLSSIVSNVEDIEKIMAELLTEKPHLRYLGYAFRKIEERELHQDAEKDLKFIGCVGLSDNLQDNVPSTITFLSQKHIQVSMATGDSFTAARAFAIESKLTFKNTEFISGKKLDQWKYKGNNVIVYDATALDKRLLVQRLQEAGKIVGVIGDGFNDVEMIKKSHLSIAVKYPGLNENVCGQTDFTVSQFADLIPLFQTVGKTTANNNRHVAQGIFYRATFINILIYSFLLFNRSVTSLFDGFVLKGFTILWPTLNLILLALRKQGLISKEIFPIRSCMSAIATSFAFIYLTRYWFEYKYYSQIMGLLTIIFLNLKTATHLKDFVAVVPAVVVYLLYIYKN